MICMAGHVLDSQSQGPAADLIHLTGLHCLVDRSLAKTWLLLDWWPCAAVAAASTAVAAAALAKIT